MGAEVFCTEVMKNDVKDKFGKNGAKEAFNYATEEAGYLYGHSGYTGTLAEKNNFVLIKNDTDMNDLDFVQTLLNEDDERIFDKWGPAGCVETEDTFIFFGWASS